MLGVEVAEEHARAAQQALLGVSQLLFVEAGTHEQRLCRYDDDIEFTGGGWRFRRRRVRFITADGLSDRPDRGARR